MISNQTSSGSFGWEILTAPTSPKTDIVFLHGLTGSRRSTFTHTNGRCWPQDFLPGDCPNARIMTFGYDADVVNFKTMASQDNLRSNAKSLLEALTDVRPAVDPAQPTTTPPRPLFFVTHSLGGLLCKQALVLANSRPEYQQVLDAYAGIIFIGTPHKGSKQAKLGGRLVTMVDRFRPANKGLVKMLEEQSPELSALDDDFWALMDGSKRACRVHCYHESSPMPGLGVIVTPESSSRPGGSTSSLVGDHSNMLKLASAQDANYLKIATRLSSWISDLSLVPRPILPAEPIEPPSSGAAAARLPPAADTEQPSPAEKKAPAMKAEQSPRDGISFNYCEFQKQVLPIVTKDNSVSNFTFS